MPIIESSPFTCQVSGTKQDKGWLNVKQGRRTRPSIMSWRQRGPGDKKHTLGQVSKPVPTWSCNSNPCWGGHISRLFRKTSATIELVFLMSFIDVDVLFLSILGIYAPFFYYPNLWLFPKENIARVWLLYQNRSHRQAFCPHETQLTTKSWRLSLQGQGYLQPLQEAISMLG